MKTSILKIGKILSKAEQKNIYGGKLPISQCPKTAKKKCEDKGGRWHAIPELGGGNCGICYGNCSGCTKEE